MPPSVAPHCAVLPLILFLVLCSNFWISSQIEVAAECLALGAKNGIEGEHTVYAPLQLQMADGQKVCCCVFADSAVLTMLETFLPSPIPIGYARRMAAGDYSTEVGGRRYRGVPVTSRAGRLQGDMQYRLLLPLQTGFAIDLALKDLGHIRALAADSACPLPLADVAYNHLLQTKARHGGSLDWGAMFLAVRDNCGLPSNSKQE